MKMDEHLWQVVVFVQRFGRMSRGGRVKEAMKIW
jgi:hypothetical protein